MTNDNHFRFGFNNMTMIHNILNQPSSVVYCAIGAAMENYMWQENANMELVNTGYKRIITDTNNQQDPIFLRKFFGRKTIILIDPLQEDDLKFRLPLTLVTNLPNFRIYTNEQYNVITIKEYIEYMNIESEYHIADFNFIAMIIQSCLQSNTKMILQDFTGRDTTETYYKYINIFGKEDMLDNILFDVTCGNGDCLPELNETMASIDMNNNFIQEKLRTLTTTSMMGSVLFNTVLKQRLNIILNELSWVYLQKRKDPNSELTFPNKIYYLFDIYNINNNNIIEAVGLLINSMIYDIVQARGCEQDIADHLVSIIENRSQFINTLSILGFD